MSRRREQPRRPLGVVLACVLDWIVLGVAAMLLLFVRSFATSMEPWLGLTLDVTLVVITGIIALDFACFMLVKPAIWIRLLLQIATFVLFVMSKGPAGPLAWGLQVVILCCWIGAPLELSRAEDRIAAGEARRNRHARARFRRR